MSVKTFPILLKKDLQYQIRSYKLLASVIVCVIFGILSPLTAKYTPQILGMVAEQQNMKFELPDPTVTESFSQYLKNFTQLGLFAMIFIVMNIVSFEKENGTASFILVKPVSRSSVLLSKYISMLIQIVVSIGAGALFFAFYTYLMFDTIPMEPFWWFTLILILLFSAITSVTFLLSTVSNGMTAGVVTLFVWLAFSLAGNFSRFGKFSPTTLPGEAGRILSGAAPQIEPFIGAILLMAICLTGSILFFKRWSPGK